MPIKFASILLLFLKKIYEKKFYSSTIWTSLDVHFLPADLSVHETLLKLLSSRTLPSCTVTTGGSYCRCSSGICCRMNQRHKQFRDADMGRLQISLNPFLKSLLSCKKRECSTKGLSPPNSTTAKRRFKQSCLG